MIIYRINIVLVILLFMTYSCNDVKKSDNVEIIINEEEMPLNPDFHKLLSNYMSEVDVNFIDKEWLYYSIYFFQEKDQSYFTIWTFTAYPSISLFKENVQECKHCLYMVDKRRVVLIFNDNIDHSNVIFVSNTCIQQAELESKKSYEGDIYDGDQYMRTYKIIKKDYHLKFVRQFEAVSPFIGL